MVDKELERRLNAMVSAAKTWPQQCADECAAASNQENWWTPERRQRADATWLGFAIALGIAAGTLEVREI